MATYKDLLKQKNITKGFYTPTFREKVNIELSKKREVTGYDLISDVLDGVCGGLGMAFLLPHFVSVIVVLCYIAFRLSWLLERP